MKTTMNQPTELLADPTSSGLSPVTPPVHQHPGVDPETQHEHPAVILGLVLILCLVILEGAAVVGFVNRLAYTYIEQPANVLLVESRHSF